MYTALDPVVPVVEPADTSLRSYQEYYAGGANLPAVS
jgi:hypothetical protein